MNELSKKEHFCSLYDIYKNLLTEKQRKYFEDYYFLDLSLSEISENYEVSKNAIFDQIKKIEAALEEYEKALALLAREEKLEQLLNSAANCDNKELVELIEKIRDLE